ncbi:MAG TPA: CPBP family intramembrane glutamate endopeptidase, partial [Cellvibrio sp.]|nr:CPBP family intramembrane glutamate endopeptidase [Cellvibrio sp.]
MLNVASEKILSGILIAVVFGLILLQWLPPVNGVGVFAIAGLTWCFRKEELNGWIKLGLFLVLVPLAFWVATYRPTGFSYP